MAAKPASIRRILAKEIEMDDMQWDIRREGRAWQGETARERYYQAPEKIELVRGKLFWDDEQRLQMLGLLLDNVGVNAAVRLGDPKM